MEETDQESEKGAGRHLGLVPLPPSPPRPRGRGVSKRPSVFRGGEESRARSSQAVTAPSDLQVTSFVLLMSPLAPLLLRCLLPARLLAFWFRCSAGERWGRERKGKLFGSPNKESRAFATGTGFRPEIMNETLYHRAGEREWLSFTRERVGCIDLSAGGPIMIN